MSLFVTLAAVAAALLPLPCSQDPAEGAEGGGPPPIEQPPLCPEPLLFEPRWSELRLTGEGRVVFGEADLQPLAEALAFDLAAVTGLRLEVAPIPARSGDIVLTLGYIPEDLRENPEAFFVEVFDHVLISGQTLDGVARATARFLQLAQPVTEAGATAPSVQVAPVRIVDAPSVRWRALAIDAEELIDGLFPGVAEGPLDHVVAEAHLAGFNALVFRDRTGAPSNEEITKMAVRLLEREAARRRISLELGLLDERATPLRGGARALAVPDFTRKELTSLAARLERGDSYALLPRAALHGEVPATALGADEAETLRRLARLLAPIPVPGRQADAPPLLGVLYGSRTALATDTTMPVAWTARAASAPGTPLPPLAGEAWHGGMRADSLRGAAELERVTRLVQAAYDGRK